MAVKQPTRGLAQVLIKSLIPLYLRPTAIYKILIKEGLGYRKQNMFIDINLHLETNRKYMAAGAFDRFQNMPKEFMINTPFKNERTYRIIGLGMFENTMTGEREERTISFYTDGQTNNPDLEAEALEKWGEEDYEENLVLVGFERQLVWENTRTDITQIMGIPEL